MSKFDPEFYSRFRPHYPAELFSPLSEALTQRGAKAPREIADVGCGTGHSTASALAALAPARIIGVDPDPAMLEKARVLCSEARFAVGSGEATGLTTASFDAVTVGSAFHWMDPLRAREELLRLLKPRGVLLVYEYQFPKAPANAELNEWIRREFNLRWKAPQQKPRGDFEAVTGCFRSDPRIQLLKDYKAPMMLTLTPGELTGLILSQSRVLHFESPMELPEKAAFRETLAQRIQQLMNGQPDYFDFNLQAAIFGTVG